MEEPVKILCVDDERNVLRALRRLFVDDDYQLFTADSAEEGLEVLGRGEEIQVVISDYRMPGVNGVDFLREVCCNWPDTVRIVLSGYADTASVVEAINDGQIYKFIPKPWNDEELRITLQKAVEIYFLKKSNCQLMEELRRSNEQLRTINENLGETVEMNLRQAFRKQVRKIYRHLLGSLPMGIIGVDAAGCVMHYNTTASDLLGEPEEDLLNRHWSEVLPVTLHPLMDKLIRQGLASGSCRVGSKRGWAKGSRIQLQDQSGLVLVFGWKEAGSSDELSSGSHRQASGQVSFGAGQGQGL